MSIHCLICGHQSNWIPDKDNEVRECEVDDDTWIVMKIYNDHLLPKPRKNMIEEWWVHRKCMKEWLENHTEAETKLKDAVKFIIPTMQELLTCRFCGKKLRNKMDGVTGKISKYTFGCDCPEWEKTGMRISVG